MIPAYVVKLVLPMILEKLSDVISYVREPNELDVRVAKLEKDSHPPIFTEKQLKSIKKRLTKLEKKCKCGGPSVE
jgi:hypothetical protein